MPNGCCVANSESSTHDEECPFYWPCGCEKNKFMSTGLIQPHAHRYEAKKYVPTFKRRSVCNGTYTDFQGAERNCLPGGEGCDLERCPCAHGPMGGW